MCQFFIIICQLNVLLDQMFLKATEMKPDVTALAEVSVIIPKEFAPVVVDTTVPDVNTKLFYFRCSDYIDFIILYILCYMIGCENYDKEFNCIKLVNI